MSTILDALRRLQRERVGDLHHEVAVGGPESRSKPRRVWWVLLLAVLLLAGSASGAWLVWPGAEPIRQAWASYSAPETEAPTEPARVVAKAEPAPPRPSRPAPSLAERQAKVIAAATERAKRVARGRVAKPPPEPPPSVQAAEPKRGSAIAEPLLASSAESDPPPFLNAPGEVKQRPRFEVGLELEPAPRPREGLESETELILGALPGKGDFPDLSVETVRWHPEPSRREARVLLDHTRPIDAREGDIVAGVKVHRIDPGAVEFRLGDLRKRLAIGP